MHGAWMSSEITGQLLPVSLYYSDARTAIDQLFTARGGLPKRADNLDTSDIIRKHDWKSTTMDSGKQLSGIHFGAKKAGKERIIL